MPNTDGEATSTAITMTSANGKANGGSGYGGLTNPNPALLGDFAVADATRDYYFVENNQPATFTITGLEPTRYYDLSFFGTRSANDVRQTTFTATSGGEAKTQALRTSGAGIGTGGHNGNNDTLAVLSQVQPTAAGVITVEVRATQSNFGYLGVMGITGGDSFVPTPREVQRWVDQDAANPPADDSILFIGSSSVRRWESAQFDFADYNVIQRGWGGAWITGVNEDSPWVVAPYKPAAIIMWAGTNDITGNQGAQHVLNQYRTFVAMLEEESPHTEFFWISITPTPGHSAATNTARMEANALIKAEAETNPKLHYIDLATSFEQIRDTDDALFRSLYVDDLHLSREGCARWLEVIRPALESVVPPNKTFTPNAATLQPGEDLLFDFGPSNPEDADPVDSADSTPDDAPASGALAPGPEDPPAEDAAPVPTEPTSDTED